MSISGVGSFGISAYNVAPSASASSASVKFPGKPADFIVSTGRYDSWIMLNTQYGNEIRSYHFSGQADSLIRVLTVRGFQEGKIDFILHCDFDNLAPLEGYLKANGIEAERRQAETSNQGRFYVTGVDDIRKIWPLLVANNTIPDKQRDLITRMVNEGSWLNVTPLLRGESYPANHSGPSAREQIAGGWGDRPEARNLPDSHPQDFENPY